MTAFTMSDAVDTANQCSSIVDISKTVQVTSQEEKMDAQTVSFFPRVKYRRVPMLETEEEIQVLWYTDDEIIRQKQREHELKYILAKDDSLYGGDSDNLYSLGLSSEEERKIKYDRMKQAKFAVLMEQAKQEKHFLLTTDKDDEDALFFLDFEKVASEYLAHTKEASELAHRRALVKEMHLEAIDDRPSESSTSQSYFTALPIDGGKVISSSSPSRKMQEPKSYTRWTNAAA